MTAYDAAMAGALVLGMIWGALRGITWQLASIASLVLGYLFAYPLSGQIADKFPGEPAVARALALMASYVLVSGGVFLVAWLVRATLRRWKFEAFDRHLGMMLGGLEGLVLGLIVTLFVVSLAPQTREPIFASPAGKVANRVLAILEPILPAEIQAELAPSWGGDAPVERLAIRPEVEDVPRDLFRVDRVPDSSAPEPWPGLGPDEPRAGRDRRVVPASGPRDETEGRGSGILDGLVREGEQRANRAVGAAAREFGVDLGDGPGVRNNNDPASEMLQGLIRQGEERATRAINDAARAGGSRATRAVNDAARKGIEWTKPSDGRDIDRR